MPQNGDEAGRPASPTGDPRDAELILPQDTDKNEQLVLIPNPVPSTADAGIARAEAGADKWALDGMVRFIEYLALTKQRDITADDLRAGTGDPEKPCWMGLAFRLASKAGVIIAETAQRSPRRERRGALRLVWRVNPAWLATMRPEVDQ